MFGFLIAYGYITKDNKEMENFLTDLSWNIRKDSIIINDIVGELNMKNTFIIKKLKNLIIKRKINKRIWKICTFRCTSKKIVHDLINLGMSFNKTYDKDLSNI